MQPLRIAVMGAGLIGQRHIAQVRAAPETRLSAVIDPAPAGREAAARAGVPGYPAFAALPAAERPDGVIVATPNRLHVENALELVAAGIPVLVEKPIADSVAGARQLVEAAEAARVPLLVGHHRRHNPIIRKAREVIESGRLGRLVMLSGQCWLIKPDAYFDVAWRRQEGAGPILVNLIHDIDLFRHLGGEILDVQARMSNAVRGHAVEDSAAVLLRFANGALGTLSVSDTAAAPWSWEMTSGENPAYPRQDDESCCQIAGTHGSLSVPQLDVWSYPSLRSWWEPLDRQRLPVVAEDPLRRQVRHFAAVIRGEETPLVSGREGLATLRVIEAIGHATRGGGTVALAA
ncbi:Gfo/Idh/MocA family protein [Ancylobacter oerskovii]|uniref:Gfo/Idh/MocA family protein n=1 Tax=Ancylobacter oerskovii TaxID=459519 RepID=A0ABW4YWF3_9HYPH|nr:Gfo/Idh/MocA family oxidoreductase [Ancylobacter oerskovii]MBS7544148.1 Gfo/Idh/MocA family oxidoreductase [Ancylobacter oerskovii]